MIMLFVWKEGKDEPEGRAEDAAFKKGTIKKRGGLKALPSCP